jgi:hypothetical protein
MRIILFAICMFVLSLGTVTSATAQGVNAPYHFTAMQLGELCNSEYDTDYGLCAGYVTAIADVMLQQDIYGTSACNHKNVKSEQLIALTKRYLESNPEVAQTPARDVVSLALSRAFPCH